MTLMTKTMIQIKVVNIGRQQLPAYATPQSAGMDLRANIDEPVVLHPMERRLIPTGLKIELPAGYEAQVRPRSGLALKHGITVLNTPGTIDADYRGEVMVLLINLSNDDFTVNDGERIAQMVIARHEQGEFVVVDKLDETERGEARIRTHRNEIEHFGKNEDKQTLHKDSHRHDAAVGNGVGSGGRRAEAVVQRQQALRLFLLGGCQPAGGRKYVGGFRPLHPCPGDKARRTGGLLQPRRILCDT